MKDNKNRVLTLAELAISAETRVWIEDNNGGDEPCVRARIVSYWEPKTIAYISTADAHGTPITSTARRGAAGLNCRRMKSAKKRPWEGEAGDRHDE